jgi:hypothetical protein
MPNGSLITGFQVRSLPNGNIAREVVHWEKNGLRHGEFALPDSEGLLVKEIEYSLDTSLLALLCEDPVSLKQTVFIYVRSNWKWMCKY